MLKAYKRGQPPEHETISQPEQRPTENGPDSEPPLTNTEEDNNGSDTD
ncbi:MAG: hypothetical protein NTNFB02_10330 [Nitrospira sp.]